MPCQDEWIQSSAVGYQPEMVADATVKETWTPRRGSAKHEQAPWPVQKNTFLRWKQAEIAHCYSGDRVRISKDAYGHLDKIVAEGSIRWMPLNLPFLSHRVVTIRERLKVPPGNVASQCASRARLEEIPGHSWGALQLFGRWKSPEGTLLRMKQHRATALFHLMNGCLKAEKSHCSPAFLMKARRRWRFNIEQCRLVAHKTIPAFIGRGLSKFYQTVASSGFCLSANRTLGFLVQRVLR